MILKRRAGHSLGRATVRRRPLVLLLISCLAALLTVACGSASSRSSDDSTIPGSGGNPATRPAPIIYRPRGLSRAHRVPLVIALHGAQGDPRAMEGLSNFGPLANKYGFVVAYLGSDSASNPWNRRTDDFSYVNSMIKQLTSSQNIDPNRIYMTGFSAGGTEAWTEACKSADKIAAVAVVSNLMAPYLYHSCRPSRPVSEMLMVGNQDGPRFSGVPGVAPSAQATTALWRTTDGCSAQAQVQQVSSVSQQTWGSCTDGSAVALYIVRGGAHVWPPFGTGAPTNYSASAAIWAFFSQHSAAPRSLPQKDAQLQSVGVQVVRRSLQLVSIVRLKERVTVKLALRTGRDPLVRRLRSATGTLTLALKLPRKLKPGRYVLTLTLTDGYGRKLVLTRKVKVPKLG